MDIHNMLLVRRIDNADPKHESRHALAGVRHAGARVSQTKSFAAGKFFAFRARYLDQHCVGSLTHCVLR